MQAKINDPRLADQLQNIIETVQRELDEIKSPAAAQSTAVPPAAQEIALPGTPAGKTLGEFLKAFNSGKADALRRFHQEHGGDAANADQDMNFYNNSGGLKLHSITRSTDTEIEVLAQRKKDDSWISFSIEVEARAPHGIANIRARPTTAPSATPANTGTRPNRGGPAGGGYSTVEDLLKFSLALREHKLLSRKSTELMTTGKVKMGSGADGYGFGDLTVNGQRFFGHTGGAPGIAAELRIFPASGYTI